MAKSVEALGPTGVRVGRRISELRHARNLTLRDLAGKLEELGRPIQLTALSKVEKGQRRVDVDDLVALALAFDVSPNVILFPPKARGDVLVELTPATTMDEASAWIWGTRDTAPEVVTRGSGFFISYSVEDRMWADWIAGQLRGAGYKTFVGGRDIAPGEPITTTIERGIRESGCMIVILSQNSVESRWVSYEWTAATSRASDAESPLLPILVGDCELPAFFAARQYLDLRHLDEADAKRELLDAVFRVQPDQAPVTSAPEFPA